MKTRRKRFFALFVLLAHIAGALTSVRAIMTTRTSQGAVAWIVSLNTIPYVAVPAYWVFGSRKFDGEIGRRRGAQEKSGEVLAGLRDDNTKGSFLPTDRDEVRNLVMERLARVPATTGNDVEILRDGNAAFPSIFDGIDAAQRYLLIQFYIVRDDRIGQLLQQHLLAATKRGVSVYFVYDEVGSLGLSESYLKKIHRGGVQMVPFNTTKGLANRFQLNFRNHRKTVIADGRVAWVGGMNIGNEYNGDDPELSPWHDTMVKIEGPAVQTIQVAYREDWLWATGQRLELEWRPVAARSGARKTVLCVASGPADPLETCTLYFLQLINSATKRLWIASPYFVPDEQIITALELAALRGVEIRILVPDKADDALVDLSGWAHVERLGRAGVGFYRHNEGFMHQKVTLVDNDIATVGTANFDNRSFRLNFEMTMEVRDKAFAQEIEAMLTRDFAKSTRVDPKEAEHRGFFFRLKVRAASLLSPVQ